MARRVRGQHVGERGLALGTLIGHRRLVNKLAGIRVWYQRDRLAEGDDRCGGPVNCQKIHR